MPRKTTKQRKNPTDDNSNRVRGVVGRLTGLEKPDDIMGELIKVLTKGGIIPAAGKFYTFVYNAKTLDIAYDEYPLVAVTNVYSWGFRGENLHWRESRNYDYNQIVGGLYEIYSDEISDVLELNYGKIRSK